jgi:hypothetical protein
MKKLFFALGVFLLSVPVNVFALSENTIPKTPTQTTSTESQSEYTSNGIPEIEVQLSPGNAPTQRVNPGDSAVEVLRILLTATDHEAGGITLEKLRFLHDGPQGQFLRYRLMQANRILGTLSLISSNWLEFKNLNIYLADGKTAELRILADVANHEFAGEHQFSIPHPDYVVAPKNDIRDPETKVIGDFPVRANRIIIGESFDSPNPECNLREEPVCGVDGKTYYNLCIPFTKGIAVDYSGPCYSSDDDHEIVCSDEIQPMCADNGKTYPNYCFLQKDGAFKKHDGECFPSQFEFPRTFKTAVELLDIKANELRQLRPRISDNSEMRLAQMMFVLETYAFTADNTQKLIRRIGEFLEFTQLETSRLALEQQIEMLNGFIITARSDSAREKYEQGSIPFRDVDDQAWYLGAVRFMKTNNYLTDFVANEDLSDGFFRPEQFVTKAQVTNILFDLRTIDTFFSPPPRNTFANAHWAHNTIAKAEELGLSLWSELPNPDQKITRFEIIQLILEIFEKTPGDFSVSSFRDVIDKEEISIIEYARNLRLISGYPDGSFRPKRLLTRAEAAQIVYNAYKIFK